MAGKLTYANVMSTIAVFLALTGGLAWALGRNSVKSKHIADGTIQSADVGANAVNGANIDESSLGKVPVAAAADTAATTLNAAAADHANSADTATHADSADFADSADTADHADSADTATSSQTATSATSATSATTAVTAANATNATNATNAANASQAANAAQLQGHPAADFLAADQFESFPNFSGPSSFVDGSGEFGGPTHQCVLGEMIPWAATFAPTGTLFAHGQNLQIDDYPLLFTLIGTTYGGDGEVEFGLPNAYNEGPGNTDWLICTTGIFPPRH